MLASMISTQAKEISVYSDDMGWEISTVSPDHTSMIYFKLKAEAFTNYEQTENFSIPVEKLKKAIVAAKEDCDITVGDGMLFIKSGKFTSKISLLGDVAEKPKSPKIEYSTYVKINMDEFRGLMACADSKERDTYIFEIKDDKFTVSSLNDSDAGVSMEFGKEECEEFEYKEDVRSVFGMESWNEFVKSVPAGTSAEIKVGNDYPILVKISDELFKVKYMLAPRIETE